MKKFALLTLLLASLLCYSQDKTYNQFSFETAFGLSQPLSPKDNSGYDVNTFSGFRHFELGSRYMVNQKYGVKLGYGFDKFQQKDHSDLSVTNHKIAAELVLNIAHLFNFHFGSQRVFQIQSHTGFGITFSKPSSIKNNEHIGNFILGITPQVKISDRIALITDLSYNYIFKQHYYYSGILIDPDYKSVSGSFVNVSFGLQVNIGSHKYHADWY